MLTIKHANVIIRICLVELIIFLEQDKLLGVDEWPRRVKIQRSLKINWHELRCVFNSSNSAVN